MRPTRMFLVRLVPTIIPTEKGYEVVAEGVEHTVMGNSIKYVMPGDISMLHILNAAEDIVFAAPLNSIGAVQAATEEYVLKSAEIVPIRGRPVNLVEVKMEGGDESA